MMACGGLRQLPTTPRVEATFRSRRTCDLAGSRPGAIAASVTAEGCTAACRSRSARASAASTPFR